MASAETIAFACAKEMGAAEAGPGCGKLADFIAFSQQQNGPQPGSQGPLIHSWCTDRQVVAPLNAS
jgi:hypothetical protein